MPVDNLIKKLNKLIENTEVGNGKLVLSAAVEELKELEKENNKLGNALADADLKIHELEGARKPKLHESGMRYFYCDCGKWLCAEWEEDRPNYCSFCGARLDWGKEK